jgi:hypothetical protein
LLVGSASSRATPLSALQRLGYTCAEVDDPYAAMAELAMRPMVYRALILSIIGLYREELALISTVKQRFGHVEIWLTQTDGRQAAVAEAMKLGADGLLADDGLHRTASGVPSPASPAPPPPRTVFVPAPVSDQARSDAVATAMPLPVDQAEREADYGMGEPVLTAEELRALLQEQPTMPPSGDVP